VYTSTSRFRRDAHTCFHISRRAYLYTPAYYSFYGRPMGQAIVYFAAAVLFSPRLFSAVAECMWTIHPHIMWPLCEFRMCRFEKVLHTAQRKYSIHKLANNWPLQQSLAFSYIGSVTARHSNSGCQPNCGVQQKAPPIFGRAAITLGPTHILGTVLFSS